MTDILTNQLRFSSILIRSRLDKVLGTSKSLDSYESGPSLASRICKIERQVRVYAF